MRYLIITGLLFSFGTYTTAQSTSDFSKKEIQNLVEQQKEQIIQLKAEAQTAKDACFMGCESGE